jgi:HEAT repeat protein
VDGCRQIIACCVPKQDEFTHFSQHEKQCILSRFNVLDPEVYTVLLKGFTNENPEVRAEAASGLGHAQTNALVVAPALLHGLKDSDAKVRTRGAIQPGGPAFQVKSVEIIGALIPLLTDTNAFVRRFTSIRLGLYKAAATNAPTDLKQLANGENDLDAKQAEMKAIMQIEQNHY